MSAGRLLKLASFQSSIPLEAPAFRVECMLCGDVFMERESYCRLALTDWGVPARGNLSQCVKCGAEWYAS